MQRNKGRGGVAICDPPFSFLTILTNDNSKVPSFYTNNMRIFLFLPTKSFIFVTIFIYLTLFNQKTIASFIYYVYLCNRIRELKSINKYKPSNLKTKNNEKVFDDWMCSSCICKLFT